jgi:ABC-type siderophore export system fused ATPase/permease subunit
LLFVTGGNGSGKSTFAKLLTGLYTPAKGTITLAGQQINEQNQHWYRNYFSTIFSDFFLFSQVLDKQGELADDSQIEAILEKLQLSGKVTTDKGIISNTQLSQGQRKRLALLVSYMEDAPIYLFDEWAADQDPHFRHYFYHDLLPGLIAKGKTVIAISHDERYFHLADRVLKFDDGLMSEVKVDIQIQGNA